MLKNLASIPIRVLVTGSRGKSSLVRLLQAGLCALGIPSWGRVTGVLPREISPAGERFIERSSGGHVEEMRWWLEQVPGEAGAVVLENSAVAPELQGLAGSWMSPSLVVWTNARADHQEAWGPGAGDAERALLEGIPDRVPVAAAPELLESGFVREELARKRCFLQGSPEGGLCARDFSSGNLSLACLALSMLGLDPAFALQAMESLPPDIADFRLVDVDGGLLAAAFSANDPESTDLLWGSLGWKAEETVLLYNHRRDRPMRLMAFLPWIRSWPWKERLLAGDLALRGAGGFRRVKLDAEGLAALVRSGRRVFGCGNVAGFPLPFLLERRVG
jgi:hypothetical protein